MSSHRRNGNSEDAQQSESSLLHSTRRTATVPQPSKHRTATAKLSQLSRSHSTRTSTTSAQSRVVESGGHHAAPAARSLYGSSLPRAISAQSTSTPSTAIGSRMYTTLIPSKSNKIQSAESLSGISEQTRRPANILRLQDRSPKPSSEGSHSRSDVYRVSRARPGTDYDEDPDGIFGIAFPEPLKPLPKKIAIPAMGPRAQAEELPPALIPELQALAASSAMNRRQIPPAMAPVSSPSTMYSDSPGPWSSRNTTPMSMSSYSPGIVQPIKLSSTARHQMTNATPLMPSTTSKVPEVPSEDESRAPSAKQRQPASIAVANEKSFLTPKREAQKLRKKKPLDSPAPTPPPRKSSVKHKSPGASANALIDSRLAMEAVQEDLSNLRAPENPLGQRAPNQVDYVGESLWPATSIKNASPKTPLTPSQQSSRSGRGAYNRPSMIPDSGQGRPVVPEIPANVPSVKDLAKSGNIKKSARSEPPSPKSGFAKLSSALFGRRKTPDQTTNTVEKGPSRRGPAAGTGHEGYRKHPFRSRKTSTESMASRAMSSDSERPPTRQKETRVSRRESKSSKDEQSRDQFVAQRRDPVVILGGGGYRNRPESDAPTVWPTLEQTVPQAADSSKNRSLIQQAPPKNESMLYRTLTLYDDNDRAPRERDEDESAADQAQIKPSLTTRRSFTPSQTDGKEQIRIPTPIQTDVFATASTLPSYTTSQSSLPKSETAVPFIGNEMHRVDVKYLKKPTKEGRKLRWNLFQRSQSSTKHSKVIEPDIRQPWMEVPVTITTIPNPRSMPYYAVMDSDPEIQSPDSLGQFLAQAVDSSSQDRTNDFPQSSSGPSRNHGHSVLLPSLPALQAGSFVQRPASPQAPLQQQEPRSGSSSPSPPDSKPRRLAQVGRIPRVISRKDHHHVPPAESYSRPFSRGRIEEVPFLLSNTTTEEAERPILGIQTDVLPSRPFDGFDSGKPSSAPARGPMAPHNDQSEPDQEFLRFAPNHDSEMSISSSSDGVISIAAPHYALPVVHHNGDEEVWGEYDELIDRVWSPNSPKAMHVSVQARSGSGDLRALAKQQRAMSRPTPEMVESTTTSGSRLVPPVQLASPRESAKSIEHVRLRRSKIATALHSSMSPTSPFALGELLADFTDRHSGSTQHPWPPKNRDSLADVPTTHSQPIPDASQARVHTQESLDKGSAAQSELQYAALMTSKWLSGRLLVSPAHADTQPERHVLVIDGLKNSDWSFYCALTYPTALIHDLRESDPATSRSKPAKQPSQAPANYRQAEVSSLAEQFPFPPSFFTAVVFRFPPAISDDVLKTMLSECKRVMKPGGYLEFTLLDMDMVNMGSLTRRAVRDLKVRMSTNDPEVSLKPVGDNMQDLLGRRGFTNLNRCVVGVPVAGKVAGSIDSSSSSRSSKESYTKMLRHASGTSRAGPSTSSGKVRQDRGANFSLSDLVSDHSPTSDDKIMKMVSKVGRWWYSRTYEDRVQPTESIWADKKVLRECKAKGTGFKMFIAYAQKPVENRRRTVSEPTLPTLATVGVPGMKRTR